jgi:hypothetical protein
MLHRCCQLILVSLLICSALRAETGGPDVPESADLLKTLRDEHPRLLLTDRRLAELQELAEVDALLAKAVKDVLARADGFVQAETCRYELKGPRLLGVSRDAVDRSYCLGLAWRWTGKKKYADALRANLLAVCAFKDWNPSHFLDTAEMAHAVAVGYDWIHSTLSDQDRRRIRRGLIDKAMRPGLAAYGLIEQPGLKRMWWVNSAFNWNQVCNMGLAIGALGIAQTDPDYARKILPAAIRSLPRALAMYDPDGAWAEGPSYWGYATRYTCYGLAAMQTALGTDFGLSDRKGLAQAGYFPLQGSGPSGLYFNFADAGLDDRRGLLPSLFYLAQRYDKPELAWAERQMLREKRAKPWDVIWYVPGSDRPEELAKHKLLDGPVQVACFRTAWDDADALYLAIKAGYNQVNHGQLDLGTFVLDALGQRWAVDLGKDDYNLPGYWDRGRDGKRWSYYRMRSVSHNVPLIDGADQDPLAKSKIQAAAVEAENPWVKIDLTDAYNPAAGSLIRGARLLSDRSVLIQDQIELTRQANLTWGMTTAAEIELDGADAVLSLGDEKLTARILSPAGAKWSVASAEQDPPQADNKGIRRLEIRLPGRQGKTRIAVVLGPHWPQTGPLLKAELTDLADWKR